MSVVQMCQEVHKPILYADTDFEACPICATRDDVYAAEENKKGLESLVTDLRLKVKELESQIKPQKKEETE